MALYGLPRASGGIEAFRRKRGATPWAMRAGLISNPKTRFLQKANIGPLGLIKVTHVTQLDKSRCKGLFSNGKVEILIEYYHNILF